MVKEINKTRTTAELFNALSGVVESLRQDLRVLETALAKLRSADYQGAFFDLDFLWVIGNRTEFWRKYSEVIADCRTCCFCFYEGQRQQLSFFDKGVKA